MSELDEAWAAALLDAERQARLAGRKDIAEYLSLKNSNDLLRKAGVDWLIAEFTTLAGDANRAGASIRIATQEGHRFRTGNSTMVGHQLTLTNGVRTLFVEAGWPRTYCGRRRRTVDLFVSCRHRQEHSGFPRSV